MHRGGAKIPGMGRQTPAGGAGLLAASFCAAPIEKGDNLAPFRNSKSIYEKENEPDKKDKEAAPDRTVLGAERSLAILSAFIDAPEPFGLSELEERTGLFKSVIHRYMMSFIKAGYVVQRADNSYQLGPRAYQLGKAFEARFDYADFIVPTLEKLVRATGESTAFYIRQQEQRLCLYAAETPASVKATVKAGSLFPIDQTSSAQVLRFSPCPAMRPARGALCLYFGRDQQSALLLHVGPGVRSRQCPGELADHLWPDAALRSGRQ
jgi:hypothetical protein